MSVSHFVKDIDWRSPSIIAGRRNLRCSGFCPCWGDNGTLWCSSLKLFPDHYYLYLMVVIKCFERIISYFSRIFIYFFAEKISKHSMFFLFRWSRLNQIQSLCHHRLTSSWHNTGHCRFWEPKNMFPKYDNWFLSCCDAMFCGSYMLDQSTRKERTDLEGDDRGGRWFLARSDSVCLSVFHHWSSIPRDLIAFLTDFPGKRA